LAQALRAALRTLLAQREAILYLHQPLHQQAAAAGAFQITAMLAFLGAMAVLGAAVAGCLEQHFRQLQGLEQAGKAIMAGHARSWWLRMAALVVVGQAQSARIIQQVVPARAAQVRHRQYLAHL